MTKETQKAITAYAAGNAFYNTVIESVADALAQEVDAFTEAEMAEYGERLDSAYESAAAIINENYDAVQTAAAEAAEVYEYAYATAKAEEAAAAEKTAHAAAMAVTAAAKKAAAMNDLRDAADVVEMTVDELVTEADDAGYEEAYDNLIDIQGGVYLIQREIHSGNIRTIRDTIERTLTTAGEALTCSYENGDGTEILFERAFSGVMTLAQMAATIRK